MGYFAPGPSRKRRGRGKNPHPLALPPRPQDRIGYTAPIANRDNKFRKGKFDKTNTLKQIRSNKKLGR